MPLRGRARAALADGARMARITAFGAKARQRRLSGPDDARHACIAERGRTRGTVLQLECLEEGVFHADDLARRDPRGLSVLRSYVNEHHADTAFDQDRRIRLLTRPSSWIRCPSRRPSVARRWSSASTRRSI